MGLMYYIVSPFSMLLNVFIKLFNSYGIAIILFALVVKVVLFPLSLKGKKGMIQMNLLSGKLEQLKKLKDSGVLSEEEYEKIDPLLRGYFTLDSNLEQVNLLTIKEI